MIGAAQFQQKVKMMPEINVDRKIHIDMSNDLWFRNGEVNEETSTRRNAEQTEAQLEALTLCTKPEANKWLHFTPQIGALGANVFQRGPPMISKTHQNLIQLLDRAERRGGQGY